ncbi:class I SAM-dependent methyltransferase [Tropicimonas sp. IMCC34043]|uniref:class I SAM-dependent methyltransferase n=1 Tax=Tropicimonas sp. IMCC34043 TaxID=2248760 RepID=UPI000E23F0D0|nr:class I SAM-dependent methyltransferase [Tropicimonas sp. IMCC34043]
MGKRSSFARRPRDFYPTPLDAIRPLCPWLPRGARYVEPCAGAGDLVAGLRALRPDVRCVHASDIEPKAPGIGRADLGAPMPLADVDFFITNGPWPRPGGFGEPVLGQIRHFTAFRPVWLLLASDFAFNGYFGEVEAICRTIVAVGRVSWEGNGQAGKENAAWYLFDAAHRDGPSFKGRSPDHAARLDGGPA